MPPAQYTGFWDKAALVTAGIVISLLLFTALISILVFIVRPHVRRYKPKDLAIFETLDKWTSNAMNRFMLLITFLGKHQFLIPANLLLIFFFLFIRRQTWFSIRVGAIALSSLALMLILKNLFRRKRPLAPLLKAVRGLSFPSGHAIMAVTFFGMLIYIVRHTVENNFLQVILVVLLAMIILLIGFSRVYLRVHYPSDVLAGFIIGATWLWISLSVLYRLENYFRSEKPFSHNPNWKIPISNNYQQPAGVARYFYIDNESINHFKLISYGIQTINRFCPRYAGGYAAGA